MALWGTFLWSDGTLWADARGESGTKTAFIDRSGYRVSVSISHNGSDYPGSLASLIIRTISAEIGQRPQLPSNFEAFIDRNETTQRVSVKVYHTGNPDEPLLTEAGLELLQENGDNIFINVTQPFAIDKIHGLINPRSKNQPTA